MRIWRLFRGMLLILFPSYRPERHYMRGPGPKWLEKNGQARRAFNNKFEPLGLSPTWPQPT